MYATGQKISHSATTSRKAAGLSELLIVVGVVAILLALTTIMISAGNRFASGLEAKVHLAKKKVRATSQSVPPSRSRGIPGQYIVVLRDGVDPHNEVSRLCQPGWQVTRIYTRAFPGFAVQLPAAAVTGLLADPSVRYVEQDQTLQLARVTRSLSREETPLGLKRINGTTTQSDAVDADIAIIDTGVDASNRDLDVVVRQGFGFSNEAKDTDGHGTQVACIAAAKKNGVGIVGVAPGARIWALKVASADNTGAASELIAAFDFVIGRADEIDVANVSLGTATASVAVNLAAKSCVDAGVLVVAAAGNGKRDAGGVSPASEPSVITVAALADTDGKGGGFGKRTTKGEVDDTLARFSNYGAAVDFLAPGLGIATLDLANEPSSLDGTSAAAAHVSGLLARIVDANSQASAAGRRRSLTPQAVESFLHTLSSERLPGPGRQAPYPVINAGLAPKPTIARMKVQGPSSHLPLSYEPNIGQTDPQARYIARSRGYVAFLTSQGMVMGLNGQGQRVNFGNANPNPAIRGRSPLPGKVNYLIGQDRSKWVTDIPTCAEVHYDEIYPGIDAVFTSERGRVRYDLIVAPGADPAQITLSYPDAESLTVDAVGQLLISTANFSLLQSAPVLYQDGVAGPEEVRGRYVLVGEKEVRFAIEAYDRNRPLVIDPVLFSTYLGGSNSEISSAIDLDPSGNIYVTGYTTSTNFPIVGGFQTTLGGGSGFFTRNDVFVTKYNSGATAMVYSTYVGGGGDDRGEDISINTAGEAYVMGGGNEGGTTFPVTPGSIETVNHASTYIIIFKLNAAGNALIYAAIPNTTSVEDGFAVAVDAAGNAYLTGEGGSNSFAMTATPGAFQSSSGGAFVMKINPTGDQVLYYTWFGDRSSVGQDIAVDPRGNAYVVGSTSSTNFPMVGTPFQATYGGGGRDGFIAKVNPFGTGLIYSSYMGGSGDDTAWSIAFNIACTGYITGETSSTNFPVSPGAFQSTLQGGSDMFVMRIDPSGSTVLYSTYLGSSGDDVGLGVDVDSNGIAYVTGETDSAAFPNVAPVQSPGGGIDAVAVGLNPGGTGLIFATHLGGSGNDRGHSIIIDSANNIYVSGETSSTNFPTTTPIQATFGGGISDAFVAKFTSANPPSPANVPNNESGGSTDVTEAGGTDTFTLALSIAPTANVVVTAQHTQNQLTITPATITFTPANWNTPQTFTVAAIDDSVVEGPHSGDIHFNATSTDPNYNGIAIACISVSITDNDTPGVTVTESGGSTDVAEGGATDTFDVVLRSNPSSSVTISMNGGGQVTLSPSTLFFSTTNAKTPQTVTVTAIDDGIVEGLHNGAITFTASSFDSTYSGVSIPNVVAKITDNDIPGVTVTESAGSTDVTEGSFASDTYTIALKSQPTADVTITINPGTQVTVIPTTLTFTPFNWNFARTVFVTAVNDTVVEGNHTGAIIHTAASTDSAYNNITIPNVVAKITDNDVAVNVVVTQTGGSTAVTEGGATDTYTLVLDTAPTFSVTVNINNGPQLNTSPSLFVFFNTSNWNVPQTVTVTAVDDSVVEGAHTGTISHTVSSIDSNYNGITVPSVTVNITDNDTPGIIFNEFSGVAVSEGSPVFDFYTVELKSQPTANVTVTINPGSQVTANQTTLTFTPSNWFLGQTVIVNSVDDTVVEGPHTGTIIHTATSTDTNYNNLTANVVVSITDNDFLAGVIITESGGSTNVTEGGATDTYTVVLLGQPNFFSVNIAITGGPQVTVSPTSLTFNTSNWNVPQTVTVTAINDSVDEGPHTGTITHAVTSLEAQYNGIAVNNVVANITDNDTAGVTVTQSGGSTAITEGGATDTYTVVLTSSPTANVAINIVPNPQVTVAPVSLTFSPTNWNVPQTVTVTAVDDTVIEGAHSGTITHTATSTDPKYSGIAVAGVTASITDNDFPVGVTVTQTGGATKVTEGGATDTYSVVLIGPPTANVTIAINAGTQVTTAPATLTFTTTNWNVAQVVTVTAVDDTLIEGNPHSATITHTVTSADSKYNGLTIGNVVVSISENDFPPPDAGDTSDAATYLGVLTAKSFKGLDTFKKGTKFDDDWYSWDMSKAGTFTATLSNMVVKCSGPQQKSAFGDLHMRLYRVVNGNLIQLSATQDTGTKTLSVPVGQGERIYVWIYGMYYTQAQYDFSADVK